MKCPRHIKFECPHCGKKISRVNNDKLLSACNNVENYGDEVYTFKCKKCEKKYKIYLEKIVDVRVNNIYKAKEDNDLSFN